MEHKDFSYVKTILRSVLTSSPKSVTISQMLVDYSNLEGEAIPYKQLGYKTVYELLNSMDDVIKIPYNANMNSIVELIVGKKTSHLRELIVHQKINKYNKMRSISNHYNGYESRFNTKACNYNAHKYNYNARGYDSIKNKSLESWKTNGFVTDKLRNCIEDLCVNSQCTSVGALKHCLLNHPDYQKLKTSSVNEAINMLKHFIYIDRGGVHLKDSEFEIFPSNNTKTRTCLQPRRVKDIPSICNEISELSFSRDVDNSFNVNCFTIEHDNFLTNDVNDFNEQSNDLNKLNFYNHQLENEEVSVNQNISKKSVELTARPSDNNVEIKNDLKKVQKDEQLTPKLLENDDIDYKDILMYLIIKHNKPITVKQVLDHFKLIYGHNFPLKQFSCKTCMDFFRLNPAIFKLDNPYSTNSIVTIKELTLTKRKSTIRRHFTSASIFSGNYTYDNSKKIQLILHEKARGLIDIEFYQSNPKQSINDNTQCETLIDPCNNEAYDSDMIPVSMKKKIHDILSKYKNGILCNKFMDIYEKECHCSFTFTEYGFKSMSGMAFNLPSVFFVDMNEETNEYILYDACRRNELGKNLNDPSQYYKKIPKTIMFNLSMFFDKYRCGIGLSELMPLYCREYGRSYEPLKYGYSSERHMFESLDKMVKIHNNKLYTLDPFAYTYFIEDGETTFNFKECLPVLPGSYNLMDYKNVCDETFMYDQVKLVDVKKSINVTIAEIYDLSSFYVHIASDTAKLDFLMDQLQDFYDKYEDQYKVLPELLTPGLACTSCFEDSKQWHRSKILEIIDENHVKLLYVDFGSIESLHVSKLRLLHSKFGNLPIQTLHCSLYRCTKSTNYSVNVNNLFADMVERRILEAQFKNLTPNEATGKMVVTLFFITNGIRININNLCINEIKNSLSENHISIRRSIAEVEKKEKK